MSVFVVYASVDGKTRVYHAEGDTHEDARETVKQEVPQAARIFVVIK